MTLIEVLSWDTVEIDLILEEADDVGDEKHPADEQIELPANSVSRTGNLWVLGKHRPVASLAWRQADGR